VKGVIVQVGDPKSIVLFNNGKIGAIPTPADCHVGMVVTVKYNNKFKIAILAFTAVLLAAAGVFIGLSVAKNKLDDQQAAPVVEDDGTYGWQRGQEKMQKVEKKIPEH
jgi:chaperone required for assembly of F1-ATPase